MKFVQVFAKRTLKAFLCVLLYALCASAQIQRYDSWVQYPNGTAIAGAKVTVCAYQATPAMPCTPTVAIYSDLSGTQPANNPITTDSGGNFGFFAPAGNYVYTVTGIGFVSTFKYVVFPPTGGGGSTLTVNGGSPITNPNLQNSATTVFSVASSNVQASVFGCIPSGQILCADSFTGADASVKVNACLAAVVTAGGGICDARQLGGTQSLSQEIDVGNGAVPVTLMLPSFATWTSTTAFTGGTACLIKQFGLSTITGDAPELRMQIRNGSSTGAIAQLYCTNGGGYYQADHFTIYNPTVPTASNIAMLVNGAFDGSYFNAIQVLDYQNTVAGVEVLNGPCCSVSFGTLTSNSNYTGPPPLVIIGNNSGTPNGVNFHNVSIDHPKPGSPNISCTDTSTLHNTVISFSGLLYEEGSNADTATTFNQFNGCGTIGVQQAQIKAETANSTAAAFSITNSFGTCFNLGTLSMTTGGGSFLSPATAVVNNITGATISGYGNFGPYSSCKSYFENITVAGFIDSGPNPWIDTASFGMQPAGPAGYFQTTASCTSGLATATLAGASFFTNGGGIVIYGCGPNNTLATPGAPTLGAVVQSGPDKNYDVVAGPAGGSTTHTYSVVARDRNGGLTLPGAVATITTAPATLGPLTTSVTTLSRSVNLVTATTSTANGAAANGVVDCINSTDATFSGSTVVTSVNSPTQFVYTSGMWVAAGASSSATGGTCVTYQGVRLVMPSVTGAYQFYICRDGGANPIGATRPGENQWVDYGATAPTLPDFAAGSCTAGSATNDYLATTIVSGAGTTNLTLATTAGNSASGAIAKLDDAPNFINAWNALSFGTVQKGTLNITAPGATNQYFFNSHVNLTESGAPLTVIQRGPITFNETIEITDPVIWSGEQGGTGTIWPQFTSNPGMKIGVGSAYPGMAVTGSSLYEYLSFSGLANGLLMTLNTNGAGLPFRFQLKNSNLFIAQTDTVGETLVMYGQSDANFEGDTFIVGSAPSLPAYGYSIVPAILNKNDITNSYAPGHFNWHNNFIADRGIGISSNPTLNNSTVYQIINSYAQASRNCFVEFGAIGGAGSVFTIDNYLNDTSSAQWFCNWNPQGATLTIKQGYNNGVESSGQPSGLISGYPVNGLRIDNSNSTQIGQNCEMYNISPAQITTGNYPQYCNFFSNLATPANGTMEYCVDCTVANPCAGSGTGALAKRLSGVWVCN